MSQLWAFQRDGQWLHPSPTHIFGSPWWNNSHWALLALGWGRTWGSPAQTQHRCPPGRMDAGQLHLTGTWRRWQQDTGTPWSHPGGSISSIAPSSGYVPGDMATPALLTAATCVTIHIYFCVDCSKKSPGFKICQANFNWRTSKFEHLHFSLVRELSIKEPWVYFMSILLRLFHIFRCFWSTHHNGRWCWADLHHKPGSPVQNT